MSIDIFFNRALEDDHMGAEPESNGQFGRINAESDASGAGPIMGKVAPKSPTSVDPSPMRNGGCTVSATKKPA